MSYELLRGLYLGASTNADITSTHHRTLLHLETPLDELVPELLGNRKDVVLTGNPGDGKSHLARRLQDKGRCADAEVLLDLSAVSTQEAAQRWVAARAAGRPLLLCANEGPLRELLRWLQERLELPERARELQGQLGRLSASEPSELAPPPIDAALINLADRNLADPRLLGRALHHLCLPDLSPPVARPERLSAGRNLRILSQDEPRARLAALLATAGAWTTRHITFRQVWATLAYTITAGKAVGTLQQERSQGRDGLGTYPLDNLLSPRGQGDLLAAARLSVDPVRVPTPALDEDIWSQGAPQKGRWLIDEPAEEAPARAWAEGQREEALERFRSLKRLVALGHTEGAVLIERLASGSAATPARLSDEALLASVLEGIRRIFVSPREEVALPAWLRQGLPLWVNLSYQGTPAWERPHVAVAAIAPGTLRVLRPVRASWLTDALGPLPQVAWLEHTGSGVRLRLEPALLACLQRAATSDGPLETPEAVSRFLARLSGWEEEHRDRRPQTEFAVLSRPRGELLSLGVVEGAGTQEARYGARAG